MTQYRSPLHHKRKAASGPRDGLVVKHSDGALRLLLSSKQLAADVAATAPKFLHARATYNGSQWRQQSAKRGVQVLELDPEGVDDPQIAHAMLATTRLQCHLHEVLNVLVNSDIVDYQASLPALYGRKLRHTETLFQQRRRLPSKQVGVVGVHSTTLRPSALNYRRSKRTQKLVFASCTQRFPSGDRAIHVMKTLPRSAHDQLVPSVNSTALRGRLDHIAVGFDVQSTHGEYGASSHRTDVLVYAYASGVAPSEFVTVQSPSKRPLTVPAPLSGVDLATQRKSVMNQEARDVVEILARSLCQLEEVVRRRRFGFQSFVRANPSGRPHQPSTPTKDQNRGCTVCAKSFSLFRRDRFCQLCGHAVCSECSRMYDVEPRPGQIRQNRICVHCVVRVDACVFDDEDLLAALGPVVVDADDDSDSDVDEDVDGHPIITGGRSSTASTIESLDQISGHLYSQNPLIRSHALSRLESLVHKTNTRRGAPRASGGQPHTLQLLEEVDFHVRESLRHTARPLAADCPVSDREHNYAYYFQSGLSSSATEMPVAPTPTPEKEAARVQRIHQLGVLSPNYDHEALDVLSRVAATRLQCPMGWITVVDATHLRVVGNYQWPPGALSVPRELGFCTHCVYAEKPFVVKNTKRDQRFAHLPAVTQLNFQFYVGFPIRADDGGVVATIGAGDYKAHHSITTKEYAAMELLAELAAKVLGVRAIDEDAESLLITVP